MQLHRARERFEDAGVALVLIGQASPRHAAHFRRKLGLKPLTVLADRDRRTYKLAGLKRAGVAGLLGPKSAGAALKHGMRSKVTQGRIIGDARQLGGAIIVRPDGTVAFHQASEHAGDSVEPGDLLAATAAV